MVNKQDGIATFLLSAWTFLTKERANHLAVKAAKGLAVVWIRKS